MTKERAYWLAWSKMTGIGAILLKRLEQHFGTLEAAWQASASDLGGVGGFGAKLISNITQQRSQVDPQELLLTHTKSNPHFWTPADPEYPRLLREIPSLPPVLYYQGEVNPLENDGLKPMVAIVGTRHPSEHGLKWTRKISQALAKHNFTVVSGMAAGIDGEAHQSCLQAGGRTIAVLGTGVDQVYPSHHRQLHSQIQRQGLLISEYPAGTRGDRAHFPARNRIIAGLSRAILVMEAPEKSGSLITARYANEFGRDVYALPNSPDYRESHGCLRLLHDGAELIVAEDELLTMLGTIPQLDSQQQLSLFDNASTPSPIQPPPDLSPDLAHIWQCVKSEPTLFDVIVQDSGEDSSKVSAILLQLELLGLVSQLPGMRYQRG